MSKFRAPDSEELHAITRLMRLSKQDLIKPSRKELVENLIYWYKKTDELSSKQWQLVNNIYEQEES